MYTVLVVEDEEPISDILKYTLEREGFEVLTAFDGEEAIRMARAYSPDILLLDIMLPEKDGFEVCREVRTFSMVPIIMLTARDSEIDKVLGLEIGADDYVTKPFSGRELVARVKANLRRLWQDQESSAATPSSKRLIIGEVSIDLSLYEVTKAGRSIALTHREFELLATLAEHPGMVYTRDQLLSDVWGTNYEGDLRTVDVTVRRLREKLETDPGQPEYVLTKRGVGYFAARR